MYVFIKKAQPKGVSEVIAKKHSDLEVTSRSETEYIYI